MEGNLDLTKSYGFTCSSSRTMSVCTGIGQLWMVWSDWFRSDKRRFGIYEGKIRALYGHSLPGKVLKMSVQPPAILFHGTSSRFIKQIKHEGLKPRGRQYVHLSVDQETALLVAKRKQGISFIITVEASKAYQNGIKFYQGNKTTWLADYVSPDYLNFRLLPINISGMSHICSRLSHQD